MGVGARGATITLHLLFKGFEKLLDLCLQLSFQSRIAVIYASFLCKVPKAGEVGKSCSIAVFTFD